MQFRHFNNKDLKHLCVFKNIPRLFDKAYYMVHKPRPMDECIFNLISLFGMNICNF